MVLFVGFTVFFVSTLNGMALNDVSFDNEVVNIGERFENHGFNCVRNKTYWLFYSVTWNNTLANCSIIGNDSASISQLSRLHNKFKGRDTIVRHKLLRSHRKLRLKVTSEFESIQISWGGFLLDTLMNNHIYFEVYRPENASTFQNALINKGNGWRNDTQTFVAPRNGIYYFNVDFNIVKATKISQMSCLKTTQQYYCGTYFTYAYHDNIDTVSRGCLVKLNKNDNCIVFTDFTGAISLRGFLYSPVNITHAYWYVFYKYGDMTCSNLTSNATVLKTGSELTSTSHQISVNTSGYYYMELTATTGSNGGPIQLQLVKENQTSPIMELMFTYHEINVWITRSVSSIKHLQAGDVVTLSCVNSNINGLNGDGVAFLGLLLYPS